jgi:hypothetical protein
MNQKGVDALQPPRAPQIERRFRLGRLQWIGIPLLMLIPFLALVGVFEESRDTVVVSSPEIEMGVRYAERQRYTMLNEVLVVVRNTSRQSIDTLTVGFDPDYLKGFSGLTFTPSAGKAFEVDLLEVRPGKTRRVWAEMQARRYGWHRGQVFATAGGADSASAVLSTFIFP